MSCTGKHITPQLTVPWSRVQSACTYAPPPSQPQEGFVYLPFLKKSVPANEVAYQVAMFNKGNVLQYKNNSSNLTRSQKYSKIAQGLWTNRNTTWATQSDKYTNPNTDSLLRTGGESVFLTTGVPTTEPLTCPYFYQATPVDNIVIARGGNLVCNATENICTGEVQTQPSAPLCNPTSNSDVPGPIIELCWNDGTPTWYPKQRYFMSNGGIKPSGTY